VINTTDIISVLKGNITALHISGAFNEDVARVITGNFTHNSGLTERKDGVPGQYIGASHYKKDAKSYFTESSNTEKHTEALFGDLADPVRGVFDALSRTLRKQGIELRRAKSQFGQANMCRTLCWSGTGNYALEPHDDVAQVLWAGDDYELRAVSENTVVALNFYPSLPDEGGNLRIWEHKPTVADRKAQGVEKTGYPYSPEYLKGIPYHDFELKAGDMVLIDGGFVHGVTKQSGNGSKRLLLHCFVGFCRPDLVLWWT
jgi:hypothetical protein